MLDVGCGTGVLLHELLEGAPGRVYGLDIDSARLSLAAQNAQAARLVLGDAHQLPYTAGIFDLSLCHFVLLWVQDPQQVVREMKRVTRPGGFILALAEPDYGGRIDYPQELGALGDWQSYALRLQGANPYIGRLLAALFNRVGLENVESGVLGGQWSQPPSEEEWRREWDVIRDDLKAASGERGSPDEFEDYLHQLQDLDKTAWQRGERMLFTPTFYACGQAAA